MVTANRLNLAGIKGLVLRHINAAAAKGLYAMRSAKAAADLSKMPPGLMRLKKAHETGANGQKPDVLNINYVFEGTIPALTEKGVFSSMTEAEADTLITRLVAFASQSMERAKERRSYGENVESYKKSVHEFFTVDLIRYAGWIGRKKEIEEIIAFKAGIRSEDEQVRINAIRRAGEAGMTEAAEDLLHILSTGSNKEKLEVIDVMQKLELEKVLAASLEAVYAPETKEIMFTNLSSKLPRSLDGRWGYGMAAADGKIFIYGGNIRTKVYDPMGGTCDYQEYGDFWSYDVRSEKFERLNARVPNQEKAYFDPTMVKGPDGNIYLMDRWSDLFIYDPQNRSWIRKFPHRASRRGIQPVVGRDGKIYLFGGSNPPYDSEFYREFWTYDTVSDKWEKIRSLPPSLKARDRHSMVLGADGKMYLFGGRIKKGYFNNCLFKDFWSYDTEKQEWTCLSAHVPKKLEARMGHQMFAGPDGKIYIFGGESHEFRGSAFGDLWSYDPEKCVFSDLTAILPEEFKARAFHRMVAGTDGSVYMFSGRVVHYQGEINHRDFWKLSFPGGTSVIEEAKKQLRAGK